MPGTMIMGIPVLSNDERTELLAWLKEAEERVRVGKALDYDPKLFKKRLLDIYRGAKQ
jgi:hypothetical protein